MKKIRMTLTLLALVIATAGVFAARLGSLAVNYYKSANNGGTNCDISVTPTCNPGTVAQCNTTDTGNFLVWKIDTGTSAGCVPHLERKP